MKARGNAIFLDTSILVEWSSGLPRQQSNVRAQIEKYDLSVTCDVARGRPGSGALPPAHLQNRRRHLAHHTLQVLVPGEA